MSKIYNEKYDVKDSNGHVIEVVKITDTLYLVNGMLFESNDMLDMTKFSDLALCLIGFKKSLLYNGKRDVNWVISFVPKGETYGSGIMRVSLLGYPEDVIDSAKRAFVEYDKKVA